jgi:hypothetical protein
MLKPLALPVRPVTPPPPPAPPVVPPPTQGFIKEVIDHMLVPALQIMPKKPEDIGKQNRAPVVKLDE